MLLQQPRLNSCRNGLEVIWNSPETNVELIWNTHGNIYKVYFNMSVTQVELSPGEITIGQIIIFWLKKEMSYSTEKGNNQSCAMLTSAFH
jgi:hypothetical protein